MVHSVSAGSTLQQKTYPKMYAIPWLLAFCALVSEAKLMAGVAKVNGMLFGLLSSQSSYIVHGSLARSYGLANCSPSARPTSVLFSACLRPDRVA